MSGPGFNVMSLEEIEALGAEDDAAAKAAADAAAQQEKDKGKEKVDEGDPLDRVLDGEGVPDLLKGKTVRDGLKAFEGLSEGYKQSEAERQRLLNLAAIGQQQPPREEKPDPELTDEQLEALAEKSPLAAQKAIAEAVALRTTRKLFEERVAPVTGTRDALVATQELLARQRHVDLFKRYGTEIAEAVKAINPNALTNPRAWDDVVNWVRGKHFDEEVAIINQQVTQKAQDAQREAAGVTVRSSGKSSGGGEKPKLDPLEREVMAKMGVFKDEADYVRWRGKPQTSVED
jgi:hypothetical protein